MRKISPFVVAFAATVSSVTLANSTDGAGFGLSLRVPITCDATIEAMTPVAGGVEFSIRELCNGGSGYDLELLHDGAGVQSMTYNNIPVSYDGGGSTILATRSGPYHGRRTLFIATNGMTPRVFGVAVRRGALRL